MCRPVLAGWHGEERQKEFENFIAVRKGKAGIQNGIHSVRQKGDVACLPVNVFDHVESSRLYGNADGLQRGQNSNDILQRSTRLLKLSFADTPAQDAFNDTLQLGVNLLATAFFL